MTTKPVVDPDADRDPVTLEDLEEVVGEVLVVPVDARPKSENREPTREELGQRWKLRRRNGR